METSLKVLKKTLQSILNRLAWKSTPQPNSPIIVLSNLNAIRQVLNDTESLKLFGSIISALKSSAVFTSANDSMSIQTAEAQAINNQLNQLKILVQNFSELLTNVVPEESVDSINIKLPPLNDFDQLSKVSREIHLALTQVIINDEINGQTKIESVENGSIWINVFIGAAAVTVVASLVWSAAVIHKKILEGKLLQEQIRGLKVKNESMEDVLKAQRAETDLMIQAEAEHIQSEHFKEKVPENIERIKSSITTFADLIGRGAEIQPALVAPEDVSNLFPDPTKLVGLESKIKRLAS
jgi:hypothetical protein